MNTEMIVTLVILAITAGLFVSGRFRTDLVAVSALVSLVLFGVLTTSEALSGFSNSVVIMMIGLFVVGGGIFRTGLAKMISGKILKFAGTSELRLLVTIMLVTVALGSFVSNTGTVAVMLPIVVSLAMSANMNPSRLLMPLAFASSISGLMTLIGTPPNLIISDALEAAGYGKLGFFTVTPVGLIALVTGIVLLVPLSKLLVRDANQGQANRASSAPGRSPSQLANRYRIANNLYRMRADAASLILEKPMSELNITGRYQVSILEIRRRTSSRNPFFKTVGQQMVNSSSVIHEGDILYVLGGFEQVERFARECGLILMDKQDTEKMDEGALRSMMFQDIGIAEVLLTPESKLLDRKIEHAGFRENYHVNILGIQRKGSYILQNLKDEKIRFGDTLLVQGSWEDLARLGKEQEDLVVVGQPLEEAAKVTLDHKAPVAAGIMLLMVVLMLLEIFPTVITVMISAILMVVTGCVRNMEEAYKTVNWETIVLIGSMMPVSLAVEKSGAAQLLSEGLVNSLGAIGPIALLAGIYFAASFLTLFISNTAAAVLFTPIALSAATQIGVSPYPFLFAVTAAVSLCFASPFSTPPNALVMSAGRYKFIDYIKVGLPLQLVMGIVLVAVLPLLFPF